MKPLLPLCIAFFLLLPHSLHAQAKKTTTRKETIVPVRDNNTKPSDTKQDSTTIPTIAIDDAVQDDGDANQSSGSMFAGTRDQFLRIITGFGINFRFQQRGFNGFNTNTRGFNTTELEVNGILLEDLVLGRTTRHQLGALSTVLYNKNEAIGLKPSPGSYGDMVRTTYIDATAAAQRKGTSIDYSIANRSYRSQVRVTHNSGLTKKGWAYSVSALHRWANEGYVPGTYTDVSSMYASVTKVIKKSQISLTAFGSSIEYARPGFSSTDEVFRLAGTHYYNNRWGYQEGEKRNAFVNKALQPLLVANYSYKPNDRTQWNTSLGYQFGKKEFSSFDGYNSYSPRPDYYRNLPSYYLNLNPSEPDIAAAMETKILSNPDLLQVNWTNVYNSNYMNNETLRNVNGITGNNVTGRRSLYVIGSEVDDLKKINFNTTIQHSVSEHITLYGGLKATQEHQEIYYRLDDLLGGDYFVNYNQFATQQSVNNANAIQRDIDHPNQAVKVGDIYRYHLNFNYLQSNAWGQAAFIYKKVEFFGSADVGYTSFSREGLMRNGLYPTSSFGQGQVHNFLTPKVKAGVTYKLDNRNYVFVNAEYREEAPNVRNAYIDVITRDQTISNPITYKATTLEAGYSITAPKFYARITGYTTGVKDYSSILRFYNDDPSILSFVEYAMTGVSMRSTGLEFSGNYKIDETWSVTGVAATGQTYYTNSPMATVYQDNDPTNFIAPHKVYIKNYYATTGPQSVYALRLNYAPRNYWHVNAQFNYMDNNYVSINPDRRTPEAVDLVSAGSAQWRAITGQEKLPSAYTIDLYGGKSFLAGRYFKKMKHKTTLNLNVGISNILDNKNIKRTGYEQLRYDYVNRNPDKFANTYNYAIGASFFANIALRF